MKKLSYTTSINAPAAKVWQVLWNDMTYRKWTSVFSEGSYAVSDWKEGSEILFLSTEGHGMYAKIHKLVPNEYMAFKHLGEIKENKKQPPADYGDGLETYTLKEENGKTTLRADLDAPDDFAAYFEETFPKALALVKDLSEKPIVLTVETHVAAPVEKTWEFWTKPEHITKWNSAHPDWHSPRAENDLRKGGKFMARMEAKDGSMGFDFGGVYDEVKSFEQIAYTMDDGRKVHIQFAHDKTGTKITESFDAEQMNSLDLQQTGWQAIMDNFKKYIESN